MIIAISRNDNFEKYRKHLKKHKIIVIVGFNIYYIWGIIYKYIYI